LIDMSDYEAGSDGRQRLTAACEARLRAWLSEVFTQAPR
jgi:hypothetical protein